MISDEEIKVIMDDVFVNYGYDFSNYAEASLKRRVRRIFDLDKFTDFSEFRKKINEDAAYLPRLVEEITVNVTEMFRDPSFYKSLRESVIPQIESKPFIRIWHAGCSTGEEVYSMAIVLKEMNLLHKSILYATDLNPQVLEQARNAFFPLSQMKQYSQNYLAAGGTSEFSSYYTANYGQAKLKPELAEKIVFSTHNLVSDSSFNSFDLVMCRNVIIYFNKDLQEKVFNLFDSSLENLGFLALGSRETLKFSAVGNRYSQWGKEKIWRKMR